jgi:toxin-antitoxin system PIN domain toxin
MNSRLLPDINVWVALNFSRHAHHTATREWYEGLPASDTLLFCRQTQLGLFRILTTVAVMQQEVLTQRACWQVYDRWIATGQLAWADESRELEVRLRALTSATDSSPKAWMDAYLSAFVEAGNLTLVTLDKALAAKAKGAVLLG